MELGPSGFPFENYLSQILNEIGYKVQVGKIINGKCVTHEIDVIAEKNSEHFMNGLIFQIPLMPDFLDTMAILSDRHLLNLSITTK